ncbi:MAG: hypothetical protein HW406_1212 [Candidatus Brocadiaceae bacterium]|nr:hypothetical protein [Candidatus Brocadiaceae bacterium]
MVGQNNNFVTVTNFINQQMFVIGGDTLNVKEFQSLWI